MLKLKPHHHLMLVLLVLFVLAWLTWTFWILPRSEMAPRPVPEAPRQGESPGNAR